MDAALRRACGPLSGALALSAVYVARGSSGFPGGSGMRLAGFDRLLAAGLDRAARGGTSWKRSPQQLLAVSEDYLDEHIRPETG